MTSQNKIIMC